MGATIYVNGKITGEEEAVVRVLDHGFLYGEGVYEVMRTYARKPFLFDRHMQRLRRSAGMVELPVPFTDEQLLGEIERTAARFYERHGAKGGGMETYIRVVLTRGVGSIGYDLEFCPSPTLVIIIKPHVDPSDETYERGVSLATVPVVRNHPSSVNPIIKSNNLMNNALAWQSAHKRGAYDALMRNYRGEVSECATSNVFVVQDGTAKTPPLDAGLLPGITRGFVLECGGPIGVPIVEATLRDEDVFGADEVFITGTTREIVPVVRVDEHPIGAGVPGEITLKLLAEFRRRVRAENGERRTENVERMT